MQFRVSSSGRAAALKSRRFAVRLRGPEPAHFRRSQVVEGIWLQSRRAMEPQNQPVASARRFCDASRESALRARVRIPGTDLSAFIPASVRIGPPNPCLVSSADQSSRLLPGRSAVRIGHETPGFDQPVSSRCGAVGSVRDLGSRGRRFEPCHRDQTSVCLGVAVAQWQSRGL